MQFWDAFPLIPEGVKHCVDDGAKSIVGLPYLNSGRHVTEDIPGIINEMSTNYPDIDIGLAPHLGSSDMMMDLLIKTASVSQHSYNGL